MMYLCYPAVAFSVTTTLHSAFTKHPISMMNGIPNANTMRSSSIPTVLHIRGGEEESPEMIEEIIEVEESIVELDSTSSEEEITTTAEEFVQEDISIEAESDSTNQIRNGKTFLISPIVATLKCMGASYSGALIARPIITKALTAGLTFALSDWTAQRIESKPDASKITKSTSTSASKIKSEPTQPLQNWKRTMFSAAVGLLFFGPAAHYWYDAIFKLLPATTLFSTVQKAFLGQIIFGPIFTCVFFASALLQDNVFTIKSWIGQIKRDLPGVWLSGLGYWPLMDMISYGLIPIQFIPLFINLASFIWTIYLSLVANSSAKV